MAARHGRGCGALGRGLRARARLPAQRDCNRRRPARAGSRPRAERARARGRAWPPGPEARPGGRRRGRRRHARRVRARGDAAPGGRRPAGGHTAGDGAGCGADPHRALGAGPADLQRRRHQRQAQGDGAPPRPSLGRRDGACRRPEGGRAPSPERLAGRGAPAAQRRLRRQRQRARARRPLACRSPARPRRHFDVPARRGLADDEPLRRARRGRAAAANDDQAGARASHRAPARLLRDPLLRHLRPDSEPPARDRASRWGAHRAGRDLVVQRARRPPHRRARASARHR